MICPILPSDVVHIKDRRLMDRGGHAYCCRQQEALLYEDDKSLSKILPVFLPFNTHIQDRLCQRHQCNTFEAIKYCLVYLIQFAILNLLRKMILYNILIARNQPKSLSLIFCNQMNQNQRNQ
ncbi:hypothetical protein AHAS_Ahas01G0122800 [Arachis hypogaea]